MVSFHELREPRAWANEVADGSKQCMHMEEICALESVRRSEIRKPRLTRDHRMSCDVQYVKA
jgi:hypothetical protein